MTKQIIESMLNEIEADTWIELAKLNGVKCVVEMQENGYFAVDFDLLHQFETLEEILDNLVESGYRRVVYSR